VFENRVLRRIFGPKRDEVIGEWEKLHNEELNDLFFSSNIFWAIKWRRMRRAKQVARVGRGDLYTGFWWGNMRVRDHLEDSNIDERIILRWTFRKWYVGAWTGLSWLRRWRGGGNL
jgi:hypothetical protein